MVIVFSISIILLYSIEYLWPKNTLHSPFHAVNQGAGQSMEDISMRFGFLLGLFDLSQKRSQCQFKIEKIEKIAGGGFKIHFRIIDKHLLQRLACGKSTNREKEFVKQEAYLMIKHNNYQSYAIISENLKHEMTLKYRSLFRNNEKVKQRKCINEDKKIASFLGVNTDKQSATDKLEKLVPTPISGEMKEGKEKREELGEVVKVNVGKEGKEVEGKEGKEGKKGKKGKRKNMTKKEDEEKRKDDNDSNNDKGERGGEGEGEEGKGEENKSSKIQRSKISDSSCRQMEGAWISKDKTIYLQYKTLQRRCKLPSAKHRG